MAVTRHWGQYLCYIKPEANPAHLTALTINTQIMGFWGATDDIKAAEVFKQIVEAATANMEKSFSAPGHFVWEPKVLGWVTAEPNTWLFDLVALLQPRLVIKPWPKYGVVLFMPSTGTALIKPLRTQSDMDELLKAGLWMLDRNKTSVNPNSPVALWTDGQHCGDLVISIVRDKLVMDICGNKKLAAVLKALGTTVEKSTPSSFEQN